MRYLLLTIMVCLLASSVNAAIADDIVAYWELNDASGVAVDAHASYDGDVTGCTYEATGIIGTGLGFEGSDDIDFGDMGDEVDGLAAFTTAAWIYPIDNSTYVYQSIIAKAGVFILRQLNNGSGRFDVIAYTPTIDRLYSKAATTMVDRAWQHVALVYDGNDLIFYYNGVADTSKAATGTMGSSATAVIIGKHPTDAADYFEGTIDEAGTWSRALHGLEIKELYNDGAGLAYPFDVNVEIIDGADIEDTWISSAAPDNNFGGDDYNTFGTTAMGKPFLIRFDLSAIPSDATITAASIETWQVGSADPIYIRRLNDAASSNWSEGTKTGAPIGEFETGCTFNERSDQYSFHLYWADGSGNDFSYNDLTAARDTVIQTVNGFSAFNNSNIVDDIQNKVDGTYTYLSHCIYHTSAISTIHSSESAVDGGARRPRLVVVYDEAVGDGITRRRQIITGD